MRRFVALAIVLLSTQASMGATYRDHEPGVEDLRMRSAMRAAAVGPAHSSSSE